MAILSSHILDSIIGDHASGIRVECWRIKVDGSRDVVFDVAASEDGRISEKVEFAAGDGEQFELHIHAAEYFAGQSLADDGVQIMPVVVVRVELPDPGCKYHVPVMLSPHSYSIWWSGAASTR